MWHLLLFLSILYRIDFFVSTAIIPSWCRLSLSAHHLGNILTCSSTVYVRKNLAVLCKSSISSLTTDSCSCTITNFLFILFNIIESSLGWRCAVCPLQPPSSVCICPGSWQSWRVEGKNGIYWWRLEMALKSSTQQILVSGKSYKRVVFSFVKQLYSVWPLRWGRKRKSDQSQPNWEQRMVKHNFC